MTDMSPRCDRYTRYIPLVAADVQFIMTKFDRRRLLVSRVNGLHS